jgi:hypothetical protein
MSDYDQMIFNQFMGEDESDLLLQHEGDTDPSEAFARQLQEEFDNQNTNLPPV